jgi:hypothetical protein
MSWGRQAILLFVEHVETAGSAPSAEDSSPSPLPSPPGEGTAVRPSFSIDELGVTSSETGGGVETMGLMGE